MSFLQKAYNKQVNIVELNSLRPALNRAARFEGAGYGCQTSFFVVNSPPGSGVNKHRHPYQEILIILSDDVEVIVGGEKKIIGKNNAVIVPPKTWHEFTNLADANALLVTIHSSPEIIQADWKNK
jgi:quercetin dioxygenase-like cupin family protein